MTVDTEVKTSRKSEMLSQANVSSSDLFWTLHECK